VDYVLGLDFGGTKLAAGLVDPVSGAVVASARCSTPVDAERSIAAIVDLVGDLVATERRAERTSLVSSARFPLRGIGISFGGPVAVDGRTVRLSMHVPGWEQMPLADRFERLFGVPVAVANDGDAAALAEYRFGAGRGMRHLLYFTISTGIGGGVIVDGRLHRGERAWAGEVGHVVLDPDGPPCPCGRNGCLESLASGLSIARTMRERAQMTNASYKETITAQDVAIAAAKGDLLAQAVWEEAMVWLGIGIASAANVLDPGCVVLGGGLTRAGDLLFEPVRRVVAQRALDPDLTVVPARLGDEVGIVGGAALMIPDRVQ
jgi:glucokinase